MRTRFGLKLLLGSVVCASAGVTLGCSHYYEDYYLSLVGTGGAGGAKPDCSGDPSAKNVTDACGVFVQSDATGTTEDGTQAHPYKTLQKAVDNADGKRVYACAGAPFAEAVTIAAGVEMYGGFDCAKGWAWAAEKRSTLNGLADVVALTIGKNASGAKVEGFAISGASPSNMKGGGSSIVVAVDDVVATLERCDVKAGDAADGASGQPSSTGAVKGADAPMPDAMTENACINAASLIGGSPGVTTCDDGMASGGAGGKGGITGTDSGDGQKGADGSPVDMMNGLGGAGESAIKCANGAQGNDGTPGTPGFGGSTAGDKLVLTGITNSDLTDGKSGTKAQGGGGGGGAKSGTFCAGAADGNGASGGGGGGGGCGGKGGGGGKAGGSSIAIVSLGAKLMAAEVTLAVGKAGKGGDGTAGQSGGAVGAGAFGGAASGMSPSKAGCKGGDGGVGGDGGLGGGGRGGHALGVAYGKAPASMPMVKVFMPGIPGSGGTGGTGAPMTSNGAQGIAAQCWDFSSNAACK
jgi:hypothetical protein